MELQLNSNKSATFFDTGHFFGPLGIFFGHLGTNFFRLFNNNFVTLRKQRAFQLSNILKKIRKKRKKIEMNVGSTRHKKLFKTSIY